ncbi:hypothetical protein KC220_28395, partial [Mycobacterium tuberculosis]|nr:hypothetical protein [Mycobacterium tuberculosis]
MNLRQPATQWNEAFGRCLSGFRDAQPATQEARHIDIGFRSFPPTKAFPMLIGQTSLPTRTRV